MTAPTHIDGPSAAGSLGKLDEHARELDSLSKALHAVSQKLEPAERAYTEFVEKFEVGLFLKSEAEDGPRLPGEAMRLKLARRDMPAEMLGEYEGLKAKRQRLKDRISDIKAEIEAQRSILSALKEEAAASGYSVRRAA